MTRYRLGQIVTFRHLHLKTGSSELWLDDSCFMHGTAVGQSVSRLSVSDRHSRQSSLRPSVVYICGNHRRS